MPLGDQQGECEEAKRSKAMKPRRESELGNSK